MELRTLSYVITIYEEQSLTKAAKKLFITQPALTQYIKKQEQIYNMEIFSKNGHALSLSPFGEMLVREGKTILHLSNQLEDHIHSLACQNQAVIHFGMSPFYCRYYLPQILSVFTKQYPDVRLDVTEKISIQLEQLTAEKQLDLCFVPSEPKNPLLEYKPIFKEEIYLAVPRENAINSLAISSTGIPYIHLEAFRDEPFIMLSDEQKITSMCNKMFERAGFSPKIIYKTMNWDTLYNIVESGVGVGFIPEVLAQRKKSEHLNLYRIADIDTAREYSVAYVKDHELTYSEDMLIDLFSNSLR